MVRNLLLSLAWVGLVGMVTVGCTPEPKAIQLQYSRPAAYQVPEKVKRIAVAEFTSAGSDKDHAGDLASDKLISSLDDANKKYSRYQLVDRKRLKEIMDQRDVNIAVSDPSSAAKAGKLAGVDGVIYGSVTASCKDEHNTRTAFDPLSRSTKTVSYVRRTCHVAVSFTMDDINSGLTLVTMSPTREFDSDKQSKGGMSKLTKMMGMGSDNLPPSDQLINQLINECVDDFVAKISPHDMNVPIELGKGKSKLVARGNTLAHAGEYKDALELYEKAITENPDDADAYFDAGAMYEALQQWKDSERMYSRAFDLRPEPRFVDARKRVRFETAEGSGATKTEKSGPATVQETRSSPTTQP